MIDIIIHDEAALVKWAMESAPELLQIDQEALAARLMLDDENLGELIDMGTGLSVPGVGVEGQVDA